MSDIYFKARNIRDKMKEWKRTLMKNRTEEDESNTWVALLDCTRIAIGSGIRLSN